MIFQLKQINILVLVATNTAATTVVVILNCYVVTHKTIVGVVRQNSVQSTDHRQLFRGV